MRGLFDRYIDAKRAKNFEQALLILEALPEDVSFHAERAFCLEELGRFEEAINELSLDITQSPSAESFRKRGMLYTIV